MLYSVSVSTCGVILKNMNQVTLDCTDNSLASFVSLALSLCIDVTMSVMLLEVG